VLGIELKNRSIVISPKNFTLLELKQFRDKNKAWFLYGKDFAYDLYNISMSLELNCKTKQL
jgi:hypothetical protein